MPKPRVTLPGSERSHLEGARVVGRVSPDERMTVTLVLKPAAPVTPEPGRFLSPAEFAARHGAPREAINIIRQFANDHGLTILDENAVKRTVRLSGSASDMNAAFGVDLQRVELEGKTFRHRVGPITVPGDVASVVSAVMGLDNRPQASPRSHFIGHGGSVQPHSGSLLTPIQVAQLYNFPTGVTGSGEIVAIIELGGGFSQADLNTYFSALGLSTMPSVSAVPVSAPNNPGVDTDSDREVMLDIEVVGGIAPGAKQLVYFAQNTDQDFLNAALAAIHANPAPTALSISWGKAEHKWTAQARQSFTQAFLDAAVLGISVFVASGDSGSSDGEAGLAVDFPASSPAAIGCGGTTITASGNTIASEVVWNDAPNLSTGGGVSTFFSKPAFQSGVTVPPPPSGNTGGRGVPDVSGHAAGWTVRVDGKNGGAAGTSAVAPMWAGLTALLAQKLNQPLGFLNLQLYVNTVASSSFRDITSGTNDSNGNLGQYNAGSGWDACTGLGSPKGTALAAALGAIHPPTPHPPTPHPPTPHPPTPHPPTPHPPTPHPPTPHPPTPHPPTPHPGSGGTGTTGHAELTFPEMPPYPVTPEPPVPPAAVTISAAPGGNAVAIVAVVGLAALMGMVAATGVVGVVAINKDKS